MPYFCTICSRPFSSTGYLRSHEKQAQSCRDALERKRVAANLKPVILKDLTVDSDQEDDPDFGDNYAGLADDADLFGLLGDEPMPFDEIPPFAAQAALEPDVPASTDNATRSRAEIEAALDVLPAHRKVYKGAGKILGYDRRQKDAYERGLKEFPSNPYHPFANHEDWHIAKWAKEDDVGLNSFTKLLKVNGVRLIS